MMDKEIGLVVCAAIKELEEQGHHKLLEIIKDNNYFLTMITDDYDNKYVLIDFESSIDFHDKDKFGELSLDLYLDFEGREYYEC